MRFIFCRFEIAKMLPSHYLALCVLLTMTVHGFNMPLLSNIIPKCSYTVHFNLSGIEVEFPIQANRVVYPHHTEKIEAKTGSQVMKKFVNIAKGKTLYILNPRLLYSKPKFLFIYNYCFIHI